MLQVQHQNSLLNSAGMEVTLRTLKSRDYHLLERLLSRVAVFCDEDRDLAMELIEHALNHPGQKDYQFIIAVTGDDCPVGYACFGPTPLTQGTFDLYWIAVDPAWAGQGLGTRLLAAVEQGLRKMNGRMLVIETSSGQAYEQTRRFYLKNEYSLAETIRDFFQEGEDRVTYIKKL